MTYPASPGFKVSGPSQGAAIGYAKRASTLRQRVFDEIADAIFGLTADECAERMGETVLAIRPRFTELASVGCIEDTGLRRKNRSGRNATVWRIAR